MSLKLGYVICLGALIVLPAGCTIVECPSNMTCTLNPVSTPTAGSGGNGGSAGGGGADPSDGGVMDDGGSPAPDLPPGEWQNVTGNLAGKVAGCGNLNSVFRAPNDRLIAGVALNGLWASSGGTTWAPLGTGAGSAKIDNGPLVLVFDPDAPNVFWEAGIYGAGPGVYRTDDDGKTFTALGISFSDSVSIDFTDPQRRTMIAGAHEVARGVSKSTDGGATWTNVGAELSANRWCTNVRILDATTYLVGCAPGIYRSTDAAKHWTQVSETGGQSQPLVHSDGSLYWPSTDGQLLRSTDQGETWTEIMPSNVLLPRTPLELPDGRIAALGPDTVVVSKNQGVTWDYATGYLPYKDSAGLVYSNAEKAFFIWRNDCGQVVLDDAVMRFDVDYQSL